MTRTMQACQHKSATNEAWNKCEKPTDLDLIFSLLVNIINGLFSLVTALHPGGRGHSTDFDLVQWTFEFRIEGEGISRIDFLSRGMLE